MTHQTWPVLRSYDQDHLAKISLPLGGIGTGTIGLGGRGDLRDFELGNRPAKGFRPHTAFFAIRAQVDDQQPTALVAEGPLPIELYEGAFGSPAPNHGLPRFTNCSFDAAYPLGQIHLSDETFPLQVTIQGFNPLVLGDVATSSLPVAVLRYRLTNPGDRVVAATVVGSLSNVIGANGTDDAVGGNANLARETDGLTGITLLATDLPSDAEAGGELTLSVVQTAGLEVTHRTGWADFNWGNSLLDFWDDLLDDGRLDERVSEAPRPVGSLAGAVEVPAGESVDVTFLLTWSLPSRRAWRSEEYGGINLGQYTDDVVGNYYSTVWPNSWQTAIDLLGRLDDLETQTVQTVSAVINTDTPTEITEAALFNLSTLRSPTVFQTADGRFFGWEGVGDRDGSCFGTCTHVWGYEFATSLLFADVAQSFRDTQYALCTDDTGLMSFRAGLPLSNAQSWQTAAADGQMATLVHLYLDWKLSGDSDLLTRLWPAARRSLEFCWIPGGWDADRDGVMEGVQHNTMDVEYYGPNPQMGSWYLAALRACAEMAAALDDHDFASTCTQLAASGAAWLDEHLFTGEFYRHEVRPVASPDLIAAGLRHRSMGAKSTTDPDLQLADGCLVDQLVGSYAATLTGLGDLLDPAHVATTWRTVHRRNFLRDFRHHFNHMRSFVLAGEQALLMCTYDADSRPERPFPYFNEVMTGFEYTAATGLLQTGAVAEGLEVITAIRERYDGARRNPFDEAECGHHYARAMASWSAYATWQGTAYDGRSKTLTVGARPGGGSGAVFWSTGSAAGTWEPAAPDAGSVGTLRVVSGELSLESLEVGGRTYRPDHDLLTLERAWTVPADQPPT